jgi:hypothetical protein
MIKLFIIFCVNFSSPRAIFDERWGKRSRLGTALRTYRHSLVAFKSLDNHMQRVVNDCLRRGQLNVLGNA